MNSPMYALWDRIPILSLTRSGQDWNPIPRHPRSILKCCLPTGKAGSQKLAPAARLNGGANLGKQRIIVSQVVPGQERWPEHFVGIEQMMQVRPAELPAHRALAIRLERGRIAAMASVAQPQGAGAGEGEGVAAVARRQDAIEHVNAAIDGLHDVLGPAA